MVLAQFFHGGTGPSHVKITTALAGAGGYSDTNPYDVRTGSPNKES